MLKRTMLLFFFLSARVLFPGSACHAGGNDPVYAFLDELANLKVITLNSAVLPDARAEIARLLLEADYRRSFLNQRQLATLDCYLSEYAPEILVVRTDTLPDRLVRSEKTMKVGYNPPGFTAWSERYSVAVRPLAGYAYTVNQNGSVSVLQGGGRVFGRIGRHISYRLAVEQVWQSEALAEPEFLTTFPGYDWKASGGKAVSATEWTGTLRAAWNWGDIGFSNDRPVWGLAENGTNILSGKAPAFPFLHLHLKPARWFEFWYIHGRLSGDVIDSSRSDFTPGSENTVYLRRYIAANLFTFFPWRSLAVSFGNSIVYSEDNPVPAYFIPFLFFKAVDQTLTNLNSTNGQNNALFFSLSWRGVRHLHLYATVFVDDFKMDAFLDGDLHNEISMKAGAKLDGYPFRNISLAAEYTRTNPMTYLHYVEPIRYSSGGYGLGHYLRENSDEIFVQVVVRPLHALRISCSMSYARHGEEQTNLLVDNYSLPVLEEIVYRNTTAGIDAAYTFFQEVQVFAGFRYSSNRGDVRYYPEALRGQTASVTAGIRIGW